MRGLTRELWLGVGVPAAELERLTVSDTGDVLPSVFRVTETATASVAAATLAVAGLWQDRGGPPAAATVDTGDRKSTRLNSSHVRISYAVFCLKKKNTHPV